MRAVKTLPVRERTDLPGTIGPYRIERRLGSGGMGEVYLAYDERLDRHVAVKRLRRDREKPVSPGGGEWRRAPGGGEWRRAPGGGEWRRAPGGGQQGRAPEGGQRGRARARLRREARALARLSHPSIVPIFDLLELDGDDWLVMEHVDGVSVAELLRRSPLRLRQVLTYGRQVAEGLAAAHARGIVHRDLKAENVLVAAGRARILDFGLVRNMNLDEDTLTQDGMVLGTVRSMSPEQAQGLPAAPRSDLFSLGVLLQEMLTGRSPFAAASSAETLQRIISQPPEPLPPEVPAEVAGIVGQLLEKLPELRPADAETVARRLGRVVVHDEADLAAASHPADEETELSIALTPASASFVGAEGRRRRGAALAGALALAALALVFRGGNPPPAPVAGEALEAEAWTALARPELAGNTDRAVELFLCLVAADPDSAPAHAGLARAYCAKYREDSGDDMYRSQALDVARHAVELDGEDAEARVSLGLALIVNGDTAAARAELERALEIDPENADAYLRLGEVHQLEGRPEDAEAAFLEALRRRPRDRQILDYLGTLYWKAGRLGEAETTFRRSIEAAPDSSRGHQNLGAVLMARGEPKKALEVLAEGFRIQPTAALYLNQGTIFYFQGLYPQAATAYEAALGFPHGANYHVAWANLGDALRRIPDRQNEARDAFREAVRLLEATPEGRDSPERHSRLALYLAKAGQEEAARRETDAVDVDAIGAAGGWTLYRLALASEILHRRDDALGYLARALDAGFQAAEVEREPDLLDLRSDPRYHRLRTGRP